MPSIPRLAALDSTPALLREGYLFGTRRFADLGSDVFATRLMLRPAIVAHGSEATRLFYEGDLLVRRGALPPTALMLLQDKGSVQQLDGPAHRHRKRMLMGMMSAGAVRHLADLAAEECRERMESWMNGEQAILLPEFREILCRAASRWIGLVLDDRQARMRTRELAAMIDGAGRIGPRNWRGLWLRRRTETWLAQAVAEARISHSAPDGSPFHRIAWHRAPDGALLDPEIAAVELLNLLRPIVAIANYLVFAALALHRHPDQAERVRDGDSVYTEWFGHEVRRFYPFMPFAGALAGQDFVWRGAPLSKGILMLLDLYATNHDRRAWDRPECFRPDRFQTWDRGAFNLVPQGGGDFLTGHRCAGEWITIAILSRLIAMLAREITYDVPSQDLDIDMTRFPAMPQSGFVIGRVRPADGRRQAQRRSVQS